ncbi:MAG: adenylate/guanylate cyclase domain-containing protein, partial [Fimbriimonadaceae bacterium]
MSVTQSHSAVVLRTFTFAFTDIEGSTKLWDEQPEAMRAALARHDEIVREAIEGGGGRVFKTIGDAFCAVFVEASDALDAMAAAMRELEREPWAPETPIRVRMAVHTGEAEVRQNDYFGPPLNRVARLLAIGHGGQILVSKATAEGLEGHDLLDLGLHSLKDLADPERVYQLLDPWLATDFPELRSVSSAPRHNIPESLTTFVGRAEVSARLEGVLDEARLVSLTGAGGCGKTRLAIHVARRVLERFEDGVWFVELASVMSGDFVPAAVAAVVGVREEAGKSMTESLGTALRTKKVLIVLDNCEHLLDACAQLVLGLLEQCPGVWAMTTTREAIGVPGERVFTVPSLSLPDPGETLGRADAESYEAVALFLARAQGQGRAIEPTESNLALVGSICRQLDGIPFAIELSAARTNVLSLESIHAKLDQRFQLLTGGSRTALPRQQTLRSLIDWSYDLLNPAEQSTLRRFGVFSGGCDLEAAESLFDADALDLLSSLADKSLLQIDRSSEPVRFTILETVRQYAIERLVDAGEAGYWRARHAQHFAEFVTRAALEFTGPDQLAWYSRVDREHDNLRLALDQGEPYALTIVAGIWRY